MNLVAVRKDLERFLLEDLGHSTVMPSRPPQYVHAEIVAEEEGMFCAGQNGLLISETINLLVPSWVNPAVLMRIYPERESFGPGTVLAWIRAESEALRNSIRTVLNLVRRLSGIATLTNRTVELLSGYSVTLLDTRKTTPGLRMFEKYAVRVGGGKNHRFGRFDGELIKKEDIQIDGGIKPAIDRAYERKSFLTEVEIEVESFEELEEVLRDGRVRHIMLDNMSLDEMRRAVERCGKTHILEASGVGSLDLREVAKTGVKFISLSSLIEGAKPLKMYMRIK